MSEFGVIGVILGLWPVILNDISLYKAGKGSRPVVSLLNELKTEEIVFRESIHGFLSPDVTKEDLVQLSDRKKPNTGFWDDAALHSKFERRLGPDKSKLVLTTLIEIEKTLASLREKLIVNDALSVWLYFLKYWAFVGRADMF